jgi:transposase InsO family protein
VACRVLKVSTSGYYEWRSRRPSDRDLADAHLIDEIRALHAAARGTYGVRRVHAELVLGRRLRIGHCRVERLMRLAGLQGVHHRKWRHGASGRLPAVFEDQVKRVFAADAPDKLWVTDITQHRTSEGWVYCAAVIDVFSRRCVGWSIADHIRTELVVDAIEMARWRRKPVGTIVHSDRGAQGGFNWSSQHPDVEVFDGSSSACSRSSFASEVEVAWASEVPARSRDRILGGDREGSPRGGGRSCHRRGASGCNTVVPSRWRNAHFRSEAAQRPVSVIW